ncbi:erythromycin esterase family protein [Adhaeribacter aerolatus]|uniref:erythromycin esterase family protein n=1 Tax=Adhaeribacter aerolatus TaxID=670289 RepID=UPI0011BEA3CA|nr:erythromycin esterase family protein [Adhaeribacter aerolatus]
MKKIQIRSWQIKVYFLLIFCFCIGCNQPIKQESAKPENIAGVPENTPVTLVSEASQDKPVRLKIPNYPLRNEKDLNILLNQIGSAKVVLLGEASHGTSEYYTWRAAISKRLIQEKGFDFIAVEGEWADSYRVNNFIKGPKKDSAAVVKLLEQYNRWPTWMWGNYEVASLVQWLNNYNQQKSAGEKAGFFGLDVYCLWESMTEMMPYLQKADAATLKAARQAHKCFQPYSADAQEYAIAVANAEANCRAETNRLLQAVRKMGDGQKNEAHFVAEQNALVAVNGERYYRTMASGQESWNIRDNHMAETLKRLLDFHGPDAKAIIWEHNTHVGDARYTDMAREGLINVGQLARKEYGAENVFIVGFGSYQGSVIAADRWGAPLEKMEVPPAPAGSWEGILHQLGPTNKIILSKAIRDEKNLKKPIGHRAIGVVYDPRREQYGNYVPSVMPKRYDAFLFIDQTHALHPLGTLVKGNEPPDLYPWGT